MQLKLFDIIEEKEDAKEVMKQLSSTCTSCRLSLTHPDNRGILWRGTLDARIAIIGEAPGDKETEKGVPMIGPSGQEFDRWAKLLGIDSRKDCFITNIIQCQPNKIKIADKWSQDPPDPKEIRSCFPNRCLRILKALPNLEVVMTLGWVAASALLGEKASTKSHEAQWFTTKLLPGIPIFPVVHPAFVLRDPSLEKTKAVENCLLSFQREYLQTGKILKIVKENANVPD